MPRKTKEQKELENKPNQIEKKEKKTSSTPKKKTTKASTSTTKKKATASSTKKKTTASSTKKKSVEKNKIDVVEYYDLPYRYNQTIVKVLTQTPTSLFIYWDISDKDRKKLKEQYGENFFETTKPVLIVYNTTLDYQFEVEINDFANSWYLHVANSNCDYRIELGRRPITKTKELDTNTYISISASNEIEAPNDRILFDPNQKVAYFRNVKTGVQTSKQLSSISFLTNIGKFYDIYEFYKTVYLDENMEEFHDLYNPSSGNPSSHSFLPRFQ